MKKGFFKAMRKVFKMSRVKRFRILVSLIVASVIVLFMTFGYLKGEIFSTPLPMALALFTNIVSHQAALIAFWRYYDKPPVQDR